MRVVLCAFLCNVVLAAAEGWLRTSRSWGRMVHVVRAADLMDADVYVCELSVRADHTDEISSRGGARRPLAIARWCVRDSRVVRTRGTARWHTRHTNANNNII